MLVIKAVIEMINNLFECINPNYCCLTYVGGFTTLKFSQISVPFNLVLCIP